MFHATGETTRPDCGDAFDVTLSDGEQKLKCALSLELNPYVYKGWLSGVGQLVRVEGWKYLLRDDAASLGERTPPVVLLTKLAHDLGEERPPRKMMVLNADGLGHPKAVEPPFGRPEWAHTSEATPLVGVRQHYLRLDSDAVELGAPWEPREADTLREEYIAADGAVTGSADDGDGAIETLLGRAQPLADVLRWHERKPTNAEKRGAGRPSTKEEPPAIVGRVIAKSALLHFGGLHERRAQPHATQFTLLLADASTARTPLSVTVWNGRCEEWYSSVGVGDALLLRGYRLNWQLRNAADPTAGGKYEVSLNTSHPTSRLLPLTDAEVDGGGGDGDGLPDALTLRPLRATDRGALAQLAARRAAAGESADEETVDVVGAVLKALPPFRLRHRAAADKTVRFRRARWVVVLARGEAQPFPILLLEQHCEPRALFEAPRLLELLLFRHLEVLPAAAAAAAAGGAAAAAAPPPTRRSSSRRRGGCSWCLSAPSGRGRATVSSTRRSRGGTPSGSTTRAGASSARGARPRRSRRSASSPTAPRRSRRCAPQRRPPPRVSRQAGGGGGIAPRARARSAVGVRDARGRRRRRAVGGRGRRRPRVRPQPRRREGARVRRRRRRRRRHRAVAVALPLHARLRHVARAAAGALGGGAAQALRAVARRAARARDRPLPRVERDERRRPRGGRRVAPLEQRDHEVGRVVCGVSKAVKIDRLL